MIIKTEKCTYIVKFTFGQYFMSHKNLHVDNYGRLHLSMWDEPITKCLLKEVKNFDEPFGEWKATARCKYDDKYTKTDGAKAALEKVLKHSKLDESEQKAIFEEVFKVARFKESPSEKHYMQDISRDGYLFNSLADQIVKMSQNLKFMKNINNGKGHIVARHLARHFAELAQKLELANKEGA